MGKNMHLKTGQKIVVKWPFDNSLVPGTVVACFRLNQAEADSLRRRFPHWSRVRKGDKAIRFSPFNVVPRAEPIVFVIGQTDIYVSAH